MNSTEMIEQGARLEKILDYLELSQTAVSQIIGQSQSYISQMVKGTRRISRTLLQFITKNYSQINIKWLLTGDGEMIVEEKKEINLVSEPQYAYSTDPLAAVRREWDDLKSRIKALEIEVQRLKDKIET